MKTTLVIVRTHLADAPSFDAYDRYAAVPGLDVVFCCDEIAGPVETGGRAKVALDAATMAELGVFAHPRAGWLCGDYFYYAVRRARPGYRHYWMVEPDLRIHAEDLAAFFRSFEKEKVDLLAVKLSPREPDWNWHATMADRYAAVHGCVFPITRLSGRAIDHLLKARRAASPGMDLSLRFAWPNDEAFVATELANNGFVCRDLNDFGRTLYTNRSFRNGSIHPLEAMAEIPFDGMIWHPVKTAEPWLDSLEQSVAQLPFAEGEVPELVVDRPEAWRLATAGRTLGEHRALRQACIVPLTIARHAYTVRPWNRRRPELVAQNAPMDQRRLMEVGDLLAKRFPLKDLPEEQRMSAHIARPDPAVKRTNVAKPSDFTLAEGFQIGLFPRGFALPYVFDTARRELLMTLHMQPHLVFERGPLAFMQRNLARVVARVPWAGINIALGRPDPEASPIFVLSAGSLDSWLLDALLRAATPRRVLEPDALTQLGLHRARFQQIPGQIVDRLVWHAVSPFLTAHVPAAPHDRCVVRVRPDGNPVVPGLLRIFPKARYVYVEREPRQLAVAMFRAYRMAPELVAARVAAGSRARDLVAAAGVESAVLAHEQIARAPRAALEAIFGPAALPAGQADALVAEAVAAATREAAAAGPGRVAPTRSEEQAWLRSFDAAWKAAIEAPAAAAAD